MILSNPTGGTRASGRSWQEARLVVVVKGYPTISKTYEEAVCVAGIRIDGDAPEWVRLYPVQFRDLAFSQRFKKYQEIRLRISAASDTRPESRRPDTSSLELGGVIPSSNGWKRRWAFVRPLVVESMCAVRHQQQLDGTSLAVFRPTEVLDFVITPDATPLRQSQQATLAQPSLFFPTKTALEKIPYRFAYRYKCADAQCRGHQQTIIDWEAAQTFRNFRDLYGEREGLLRLRAKWLDDMCGPKRDTHFFVGNQYLHPESFLVLGVFWPPV